MEKIIVTTPDELRALIEDVLTSYGEKLKAGKSEKSSSEHMTLEDSMQFLKENGFPTSKAKMYRLTSQNKIPHLKYGNKLVFSKKQLMAWVLNDSVDMKDHSDDAAELAALARKK